MYGSFEIELVQDHRVLRRRHVPRGREIRQRVDCMEQSGHGLRRKERGVLSAHRHVLSQGFEPLGEVNIFRPSVSPAYCNIKNYHIKSVSFRSGMVSLEPCDQAHGVPERVLPESDKIDINDRATGERGTAVHQS
jgi:hypothetical protein